MYLRRSFGDNSGIGSSLRKGEPMSAAQPAERALPELDAIRRWRFEELLRAGYDIADAADLALRTDIDLHWATRLVQRGCPSATAARIAL
jgi:hypothetical protein